MLHLRLFFICLLGLFIASLASVAVAQVTGVTVQIPPVTFEPSLLDKVLSWIVTGLPAVVAICSALTAFIPSTNKLMAVIDVFALNWNKARNDPAVQRWGG